MKDIEILQLRATEPELYALAIEMERLFREGKHFRGDNTWQVTARHKVTKEFWESGVKATNAAEARSAGRAMLQDTAPFKWKLRVSQAVSGLGRDHQWSGVV